MRANRQYKGMLIPVGSVESKNPDIYDEIILENECECHGMGYISGTLWDYKDAKKNKDYSKEVWFICPFHTGYLQALREIEIYEYETRMQD